jgi:hypothetical protein
VRVAQHAPELQEGRMRWRRPAAARRSLW